MIAAAAAAGALFFVLWWMLQAEESPWVPAGLAASVVMLVAAFARLLVARRAVRNRDRQAMHDSYRYTASHRATFTQVMHSTSRHAAELRIGSSWRNAPHSRVIFRERSIVIGMRFIT